MGWIVLFFELASRCCASEWKSTLQRNLTGPGLTLAHSPQSRGRTGLWKPR